MGKGPCCPVWGITIAAVLLCVLEAACPLWATPQSTLWAAPKKRKRNDTDICKLNLKMPGRKFEAGKAIRVDVEFENICLEPLVIWSSGFWLNHMLVVTDVKGKEATLTKLGKECRSRFSPGGARDSNVRILVGPGDVRLVGKGIDLTKYYKLDSGKYRVQAVYEERMAGLSLRIVSNRVAFDIK